MYDQQTQEHRSGVPDQGIRAALDQHGAASDANDFATEHRIYHEDAVLDNSPSGERTRGRSNIQGQRASQPGKKRFTIQRIIGGGDLWVTEFILPYGTKPSYTVSIMESGATRLRGKRRTLRIHSWLPQRALNGSNGWTHNLEALEFADDTAIGGLQHTMEGREMDWKQLIQFALLGSSDLEQCAILLVRVSIGLFFAISGGNKLFIAGGTKPVYETLVKAKVPFPRQTAYFVAGVEFVCGSLLTAGFLSSPASIALLIDMTVATLISAISTLPKGLSPLSRLDDFLYLPEVLYVLFFIWLICSGPGKFSVDYWLVGKLLG